MKISHRVINMTVELSDWEEAWLRFTASFTDEQLLNLYQGVPTCVESAKHYLVDQYLDSATRRERDAFKAGWEAASRSFCDSEGLTYEGD